MENTEKSEILLAIKELSNKMDNMQKDVDEIKEVIPEMQEDIKQLKIVIPEMQEDIKQLKIVVSELQDNVIQLQKEMKNITQIIIPEMQVEIRKISKSVAVIEVEHGEKLDLLFDIFDMHEEKLKSNERRIHLCERHLDRHDDEIYYLKAVQGA